MQSEHLIAKCSWDTRFDCKEQSRELQNFFSSWTNKILISQLDSFFNKICPDTQRWRIDELELNLGIIALEDINEKLPLRVYDAIEDAFRNLLLKKRFSKGSSAPAKLEIIENEDAHLDYIFWFLKTGSAPWWYSEKLSVRDVFRNTYERSPAALAQTIRDLGKKEEVRRRLVWQFGAEQIENIVCLLEPWQGNFICTTASNLFSIQREKEIVKSNIAQFEQEVWFIVLTYLLVERGSLFNTAAFLSSTLRQLAGRFELDYMFLVEQLDLAVGMLKSRSLISNNLIAAIKLLRKDGESYFNSGNSQQHESGHLTLRQESTRDDSDIWRALRLAIYTGKKTLLIGYEEVGIGQVLDVLGNENSRRLVSLIRRCATSHKIQLDLIENLRNKGMERLVSILSPNNHTFIFAHREQVKQAVGEQKIPENTFWQIILAYLLSDRGSHFNRCQFVHETIISICQQQKLDYLTLLNLLMNVSLRQVNVSRFELFAIFQDLCQRTLRRLGTTQDKNPKVSWFANFIEGNKNLSDALLSAKILKEVPQGGISSIFINLAPWSERFCTQLMTQLIRWRRESMLPSLGGLDLGVKLPSLIIQALLVLRRKKMLAEKDSNLVAFWDVFSRLLKEEVGVASDAFYHEVLECVAHDKNSGRHGTAANTINSSWLRKMEEAIPTIPGKICRPDKNDFENVITIALRSKEHCFGLLEKLLLAGDVFKNERKTFSELWKVILRRYREASYLWLNKNRNKPNLMDELYKCREVDYFYSWWTELIPVGLGSPHTLTKDINTFFVGSGSQYVLSNAVVEKLLFVHVFEVKERGANAAQFLANICMEVCHRLGLHPLSIAENIEGKTKLLQRREWKECCIGLRQRCRQSPELKHDSPVPRGSVSVSQDPEGLYLEHPRIMDITRELLCNGRLPSWATSNRAFNIQRLLSDLLTMRPYIFLQLLKNNISRPEFVLRVQFLVSIDLFVDSLISILKNVTPILNEIKSLIRCLENTDVLGLSREGKLAPLLTLVLEYWRQDKWKCIDTQALIGDYCLLLMQQTGIHQKSLRDALCGSRSRIPRKIQACIEKIFSSPAVKTQHIKLSENKPLPRAFTQKVESIENIPHVINNAGLVLIQAYITPLFERLKLIDANGFKAKLQQRRAVHYLQYLATGCRNTEEPWLLLNKVLCGLNLNEPLEPCIEISEGEIDICHGLINSVIDYWNAIGTTSVEGFQGNWLFREATLTNREDHWDLIVAKRAYDVLLQSYPLSYSVIKLPWMIKPIYVTWPYV